MDDRRDLDLEAYFKRVGYKGSSAPTLETLRALHFAHATSIPFENLDVLAGKPLHLDLASVARKLVDERRGGYCFELNSLFSGVLVALGFKVTNLVGRVRWKAPAETITARSHRIMRVDLPQGPYLADIAFGALTLTGPLKLEPGIEQATPHETFRLLKEGAEYELQAKLGEGWVAAYRFTQEPQQPVDYEVASWFTSTNPQSIFVKNLIVARPAADCRRSLLNTDLTIRHRDGRIEERTLQSVGEIADALCTHFDISLGQAEIAASIAPHFARWRAAADKPA
jgi:N-hydroxyarylamine O-acetyltransferase